MIGASNRAGSVGGAVFRSMLDNGFQGKLYAINPNHEEIQGHYAYADIEHIDESARIASAFCARHPV